MRVRTDRRWRSLAVVIVATTTAFGAGGLALGVSSSPGIFDGTPDIVSGATAHSEVAISDGTSNT